MQRQTQLHPLHYGLKHEKQSGMVGVSQVKPTSIVRINQEEIAATKFTDF